ncbi:MAG: hypothetical protein HYX92_00285 [Chloroflexi bacterium]|nr:hypothetical protein [Chloroflexota bacterium]
MCLNCGCALPDDNMGNPDNITIDTLVKAAKAGRNPNLYSVIETIVHTYHTKVKGTPREREPIVPSVRAVA